MENTMNIALGVMLPLVGTTLGAGMVFFLKKEMASWLRKALLGFAAGVMVAASVWSLIIPAINMAEESGGPAIVPAAVGFLLGVLFLLVLDSVIPHLHPCSRKPEGMVCRMGKSFMLVFAVTLHNIPEGMAVGVVLAGMMMDGAISVAAALALSIGIAIQNFPEGAIISMPLLGSGLTKKQAFWYGMISGVVEPVAAVATLLITSLISPVLPYILSFAAGAMFYVVVEELIPESQEGDHSNIGTIGASLGFALMMILDVVLG